MATEQLSWMVCDWREEGEIHIVPTIGEEHGRAACWCDPEPYTSKDTDIIVYAHNLKH